MNRSLRLINCSLRSCVRPVPADSGLQAVTFASGRKSNGPMKFAQLTHVVPSLARRFSTVTCAVLTCVATRCGLSCAQKFHQKPGRFAPWQQMTSQSSANCTRSSPGKFSDLLARPAGQNLLRACAAGLMSIEEMRQPSRCNRTSRRDGATIPCDCRHRARPPHRCWDYGCRFQSHSTFTDRQIIAGGI